MKNRNYFFRVLPAIFVFFFYAGWVSVLQASPLTDPIDKAKPPNKNWTTQEPDSKEGPMKIFYPKATGQAVNVRAHAYEVPISAKAFIEQVRQKIAEKPDYQGAEIGLVGTQTVKGLNWDVFKIRRTDEISQEIWARKTSANVVFMIIYTGAGDYFGQYHDDLMALVKKSS